VIRRTTTAARRTRLVTAALIGVAAATGGFTATVAMTPATLLSTASAAPCPAVEVIFARGRNETPGAGRVGDAFATALRARVGKEIGLYGVNYPADNEIPQGANDINSRIQHMAGACPDTRLVIGGFSLGAASASLALSANQKGFGFTQPLPPGMESHVAAVALFGNVSKRMGVGGIGPAFRDRTIDQCNGNDPICRDGMPATLQDLVQDWPDHFQDGYIDTGLVDQAADYAAARLQ
jgi:cutinase